MATARLAEIAVALAIIVLFLLSPPARAVEWTVHLPRSKARSMRVTELPHLLSAAEGFDHRGQMCLGGWCSALSERKES